MGSKMMKMSSGWRRYVYLVANNFDEGTYPLHRIDASRLFFPTTPTDEEMRAAEPEDARLPQPYVSFTPSPVSYCGAARARLTFFTLFGRGGNKSLIAGADDKGFTVVYDLDKRIVHSPARLNGPNYQHIYTDPVSLALGDALYVMDRSPGPESNCAGFQSLAYGAAAADEDDEDAVGLDEAMHDWRWRCLQPPPYVLEPDYKPTRISAYAVVGGTNIWISTPGIGTYSFDTLAGKWSSAGKRVLPFRGRATYFPEYGSWLGFSSKSGLLCAASGLGIKRPSVLEEEVDVSIKPKQQQREVDSRTSVTHSYLVHLGSGRFCVAKFFQHEYYLVSRDGYYSDLQQLRRFAVLTGFAASMEEPGSRALLRMTKHKALRYDMMAIHDASVF